MRYDKVFIKEEIAEREYIWMRWYRFPFYKRFDFENTFMECFLLPNKWYKVGGKFCFIWIILYTFMHKLWVSSRKVAFFFYFWFILKLSAFLIFPIKHSFYWSYITSVITYTWKLCIINPRSGIFKYVNIISCWGGRKPANSDFGMLVKCSKIWCLKTCNI